MSNGDKTVKNKNILKLARQLKTSGRLGTGDLRAAEAALLKMSPGEKTSVSYCFFYLNITLRGGCVKYSYGDQKKQPNFSWTQNHAMGDCLWKEPVVDLNIENVGDTVYEAYISEWR